MESNLYPEDWADIVNQTYPIEFGWIGVDKSNHVGYFSTFNVAYTPQKVLSSYEEYISLASLINNLPEISLSNAVVKAKKMRLNNWHFHSRRGIIAYDYEDAHRKSDEKLNRYDLLTVPGTTPIELDWIIGIERYYHMIPRFNMLFSDNIGFDEMKNSEL